MVVIKPLKGDFMSSLTLKAVLCALAAFAPIIAQNNNDIKSLQNSFGSISKLAKEGKLEIAIQKATAYINAAPDDIKGYKVRGHIYFAQESYALALADFNQAIELAPNSAHAYTDRAGVYYALKDYDKALDDVNKALEIKPKSAFALVLKDTIEDAQNPAKSPSWRLRKKGESLRK